MPSYRESHVSGKGVPKSRELNFKVCSEDGLKRGE